MMEERAKLKNLANCTPREFLVQTNKIRRAAQHWLDITKVMDIRKVSPVLDGNETTEEAEAKRQAQAKENISAMLDAALETNVDETVELLGLLCFVEPKDIDKYPVWSYLGAFAEIINCPEVISFFLSFTNLLTATSTPAKA